MITLENKCLCRGFFGPQILTARNFAAIKAARIPSISFESPVFVVCLVKSNKEL